MTDTRQALRRALSDQTATVDLSPSFADRVGDATARHARRRRRTARVVAVAVVAVLAGGAFVALRATGDSAPNRVVAGPDGAPSETWVSMPDGPLSPRDSALAFTVGDEVLIFGGRAEPGCPAGADCIAPDDPPLIDGAAYDPGSRTWRPIADTPEPVLSASGAVLGDRLYLWATIPCPANADCTQATFETILVYDLREDAWSRLVYPDQPVAGLRFAAAGDRIIAYHSEAGVGVADLAYDPANNTWSELPVDPLQPGFDRVVVPHDGNLYLFSVPTRASRPSPDDPGYYQTTVLDAGATSWRRLPDSDLVGFSATWASFGDQIINPLPPAPAGTPGRSFPPGAAFDTSTEEWAPLPEAPAPTGPYHELGIVLGERYVASYGFVLDPLAGTWSDLPVPPDAADQGAAAAWVGDTLVVWGGTGDGATIDTGATWTVGGSSVDAVDPPTDEGAGATPGLPTPEMQAALDAGEPVVIDDTGDVYCVQDAEGGSCGRLDDPDPSVSLRWNYREGSGTIIVVDGQRRLDHLEVLGATGRVVRTVDAREDGLYLRASATQVPDTIRVVARDGTVLRTLHPAAMAADNLDAVASSGSAAD
ncbi:MAG: hypothetical protein JNK12_04540 [Acidimicrobiales bacterium]|nr:hypothetical protein [Acidimicrobiales bacterium]